MKVLSPDDLRCSETGKSCYASRERAVKHSTGNRKPYRCQHCRWWHLSSRKGKKKNGTAHDS